MLEKSKVTYDPPALRGPMMRAVVILRVVSILAAFGAAYAVLAFFTQAMLAGRSPEQLWWDRFYAWWVDFLAAGLLALLAVYLWRRARVAAKSGNNLSPIGGLSRRATLLPIAHVFLTASLYFADFAWYCHEYEHTSSGLYAGVSTACGAAMIATLVFASRAHATKALTGGDV